MKLSGFKLNKGVEMRASNKGYWGILALIMSLAWATVSFAGGDSTGESTGEKDDPSCAAKSDVQYKPEQAAPAATTPASIAPASGGKATGTEAR
jgi:hypothetical protein